MALPSKVVADYVQSAPTSMFTRRAWYFYELLTGNKPDLPDASSIVPTIELLDAEKYFTKPKGTLSALGLKEVFVGSHVKIDQQPRGGLNSL